jgi:phosphoribosylamine--glycine ligase
LRSQPPEAIAGPEEPLVRGIVDAFHKEGLRIFGPSKAAARIEGSKVFSKQLMRHADVPTAEFKIFDHPEPARYWVDTREYPVVVKADGLAAGKGVIVCSSGGEAKRAIERVMVQEEFGGQAGRQVVVEKRLEGEELSVLALVGGRSILPLPPTQDHKAVFDGDKGANTGGMGAYCPAPKRDAGADGQDRERGIRPGRSRHETRAVPVQWPPVRGDHSDESGPASA